MNECDCNHVSVRLRQGVTVSDNYERMRNKPKINGVELAGNKTAVELSLLTDKAETYEELKLGAADRGSFLLLLSPSGETNKMRLGELTRSNIQTVEKLPENLESGSYVFLLMEGKKHGTDNE